MENKEFDNYLSTCFKEANKMDIERCFAELEVNYSDLLPSNKQARILDIGCGMGLFMKYLQRKGYANTMGIDIGREAIDYCKTSGLENVLRVGSLVEFLSNKSGMFDFVILKSVIAHLPQDETIDALSAIRDCLKHDGKLVIETFNASSWTGMFMRYNDFTHQNAFTENSLKQVLLLAGFTKISIRPNKYAVKKLSQVVVFLIRRIWQLLLRCIYVAERGIGSNPCILSKLLIAAAKVR